MKPELADFLTRLAAEPETLAAYTRNPDEAMTDAGLPAEIREALSSGDPLRVHQLVAPDPSPPEGPGQPSEVPDDADTSGAEPF